MALAGALLIDGVRDRERVARLAVGPGLLEPMDSSLTEVWTQTAPLSGRQGLPGGWEDPAVRGPDLMVILVDDGGGGFRLVGNDIETGEQRWEVALPEMLFNGGLACRALGADTTGVSTHIVCSQFQRAAPHADLPASGPGADARLLVLDAQTGETVGDRPLDHGFGAFEPFGSDVVVTTALADGGTRVTREDPLTGQVRWTAVSEAPEQPTAMSDDLELETQHGVVVVDGPFGMVLSEEGKVLGEWQQPDGVRLAGLEGLPVDVTVLADGRFAVGFSKVSSDEPYGTVFSTDADALFPIDGPLLALEVDDGTASDVLLTVPREGGAIVALDARTGERVWSAAATPLNGALVLDRRLITTAGGHLIALDTGTGRRLWTVDDRARDHQLLTDGHVVLVPTALGSRESLLTAFSTTDGRALWTAQGPGNIVTFFAIGGRLIGLKHDEMIRLG